ncbi:hypothetical protein PIB30_113561, partial [Stylosanthes scabra]|nr:hypothetical protein [Stylosanthes scabra]
RGANNKHQEHTQTTTDRNPKHRRLHETLTIYNFPNNENKEKASGKKQRTQTPLQMLTNYNTKMHTTHIRGIQTRDKLQRKLTLKRCHQTLAMSYHRSVESSHRKEEANDTLFWRERNEEVDQGFSVNR